MQEPTRAEIEALTGSTVLEFGSQWCGYSKAAQADIAAALSRHPGIHHLKIEDGRGKPLGRSFGVKLWPTLVHLVDGQERGRVVRPGNAAEIEAILAS